MSVFDNYDFKHFIPSPDDPSVGYMECGYNNSYGFFKFWCTSNGTILNDDKNPHLEYKCSKNGMYSCHIIKN